jgi:hypothetical protein
MPAPWWDMAFNDHLVQRWGHGCTLCGRGPVTWAWTRVLHGVAIGISQCARCHREDPQHEQVDALLAARYDPQRWEASHPA